MNGIFISFPARHFEIPIIANTRQPISTNVQKISFTRSTKKNSAMISIISNSIPCLTCFVAKSVKFDLKRGMKHRKGIQLKIASFFPCSTCSSKFLPAGSNRFLFLILIQPSTPGGNRTHSLWLRRPTLYPIELLAQIIDQIHFASNIEFKYLLISGW